MLAGAAAMPYIRGMKNILLLAGIFLILSCNNNSNNKTADGDTSLTEEEMDLAPEERLIWITEYDTTKAEFLLKQQRQVNADSVNPQELVNIINGAWQDVKMEFRKISHDTLYVAIPQSEFLTERMGSSGATEYLVAATYNLTEVKNVRFINYAFKAGDHLTPGTYSRDDFKDFH
jgi:hypothetical protein